MCLRSPQSLEFGHVAVLQRTVKISRVERLFFVIKPIALRRCRYRRCRVFVRSLLLQIDKKLKDNFSKNFVLQVFFNLYSFVNLCVLILKF